jgi:hypothetical protein
MWLYCSCCDGGGIVGGEAVRPAFEVVEESTPLEHTLDRRLVMARWTQAVMVSGNNLHGRIGRRVYEWSFVICEA